MPNRIDSWVRILAAAACLLGLFTAWHWHQLPRGEAAPPGRADVTPPEVDESIRALGFTAAEIAGLFPSWAESRAVSAEPSAPRSSPAPLYLPLTLRRSGTDPPPVAVPVTPTPPPPVDETAAMFDPSRILDIQIQMAAHDWDLLRVQARTMADLFGDEECLDEPQVSPFTYFPANARINGAWITNVGVRKKGFLGSISSTKPALKVNFDEYVRGQDFSGMDGLTLNNARSDPSYVRQCTTYALFAQAGLPAPRCNYARVTVNGRDLGVYVHVESIKKPLLKRAFGDDSGNHYEGALSDLTEEWVKSFQRKTNASDPDRSDLQALVAALAVEDRLLLPALEPLLDVDAFLDFWAMEVLTGHWDGYTGNRNNFHLYRNPASDRFAFLPWGTDGALVNNFRPGPGGAPPLTSVMTTAHLPRRLYLHPEGRARYQARLEALLESVWNEAAILREIDRQAALLEPQIEASLRPAFRQDVAAIRSFVRSRRPTIQAELRGGLPVRELAPYGPPCRQVIGHFRGTFAVRWEQPGVITATGSVQLAGTALDLVQVTATAGVARNDPWPTHAAIQMVGQAGESAPPIWRQGDAFIVLLFVDPGQFGGDRVLEVDGRNAFAWAVLSRLQPDGSRQLAFMGMLWEGELALEAAGTTRGNLVTGALDADIVTWGGL